MLQTLDISNYEFCKIKNLSLKYQRFTTSGSKDIEVKIFDFVRKTQFLYQQIKESRNSFFIFFSFQPFIFNKAKINIRKTSAFIKVSQSVLILVDII